MDMNLPSSSKKPRMDQQAPDLIDETIPDFKEIANKFQKMLVDKTELIYIFCTFGKKHEFITAPPRFGKSVNLSMFKYFFEIEVDYETGRLKTQFDHTTQAVTDTENFRLFADLNLDIMKHQELVAKYLGRNPVLYVSFKCTRDIKTVDDAMEFCRTVVRRAFNQHKYLRVSKKLTDKNREFCENWCSGVTYEKMDPSDALEQLAEFLYQHFERDVVFLVDEYDSLVARALSEVDGNTLEDVCELNSVDRRVASELLEEFDCWMKQINQRHGITPGVVRTLINTSQQTREEICCINGVDVDVAQQLVDEYKQQMSESWGVSNLPIAIARRLIRAHGNNIVEICKKPVDMIAPLLKIDDKNIHLLGSLVTGVSYIAGIGWSGILNNITPCRFTKHHRYNQFYGFQSKEIKVLLEKLEKSRDLKVAKEEALDIIKAKYNGYEYSGSAGNPSAQIYCPWSVVKYLTTGSADSFWVASAYTEPLNHMYHNLDVKMFLDRILEEGSQCLPTVDKLTADDLLKLRKLIKGKITKGSHHLFLNFILELGYLTMESTQQQTETEGCFVKLPNEEVTKMILNRLIKYYKQRCTAEFNIHSNWKSEMILEDIDSAANPDVSDEEFEKSLRVFKQELQTLFQQYSGCLSYVNESALHCFMAEIITTGNFEYLTGHNLRGTDFNKGRLDVLGFRDQFAFLVKLSYLPTSNKSADDDLDQVLTKEYFNVFEHKMLRALNLKRRILMGISVNQDKKISIAAIRNYDKEKEKEKKSTRINIPFDE